MQLVIFDCDGVLIDSEAIASAVAAEACHEIGFDISVSEFSARFAGLTHDHIRDIVEKEIGHTITDDFQEKINTRLQKHMKKELKMLPGAHEALDRLDYPRCVCSNSGSNYLQTHLKRFHLYDRFKPYVFSAKEVGEGRGKPAPDVFLHAAHIFEVEPNQCCVIEDSIHGIQGARAAGMRTIGFVGGGHTWPSHADDLTEAGAETVVNRLIDIPVTVDALATWHETSG